MDAFKQASKQKLRFSTNVGLLTVEQLWGLKLTDLDTLAVSLEEEYNRTKGAKSFLKKKTEEDKTSKLRLDIAVDILGTKVEEQEAERTALETKEHNQKILGIIAKKKEGALEGMTIEDLEKQLK